jgi:ABC-type multidrug transport system ATPase subunit
MSRAIETVDLTRRFGRTDAVDGLSLCVESGTIFALIGPNGAGKTTTIKLLMNLIRPTRGSAHLLGTESRRLGPPDLARIGYVSENQRLPDWMTPRELLDYVKPFYSTWDDQFCDQLRTRLGIDSRNPLRAMSRGARMKTALLSSLAYRPELLILDEPFSGLDALVRVELTEALLELPGEHPWTVFLSSHDIEEVERLADVIGYIDRGRLVFAEATESLLARFRAIEVIFPDGTTPAAVARPEWLLQAIAGHTLTFIDTDHAAPDARERLGASFPGSNIRATSLPLREIMVALGRHAATQQLERAS